MYSSTPCFELIVVVMGGSDPRICPAIQALRPRFNIIYQFVGTDGLVLSAARNLGAEIASTPNLIFLDVDCIPSADLIQDYLERLVHYPSGIVMGQVHYLGEDDSISPDFWRRLLIKDFPGLPHKNRDYSEFEEETHYSMFWSLSFACTSKTYRIIGGFDETYIGYGGEDTDFALKAKAENIILYKDPLPLSFHQYHFVEDPPVQHLGSIVANAAVFKKKWNVWPMEGWLRAFEDEGLILFDGEDTLSIRRQ